MTTIAVTGATGDVGGGVVARLAAASADVVALGRRIPDGAAGPNVTWRRADYDDAPSMRRGLEGVHTLVLVTSDGPTHHVLRQHLNVIDAAGSAGVSRILLLSSLDADVGSPFCYAATNGYTEQAVTSSGCHYTIVRTTFFTEFVVSLVCDAGSDGLVRLPVDPTERLTLVSRIDVSACLAALALRPEEDGVVSLTGDTVVDLGQVCDASAEILGRDLTLESVPPGGYATWEASRLEPWWLYAFDGMFASIRQGSWTAVTDDVRRLTGVPPRSLQRVVTDQVRRLGEPR